MLLVSSRRIQFVGDPPRGAEITCGQFDLDNGREHPATFGRIGAVDGTPDERLCELRPALRLSQQRETRLRFESGPGGALVRRLRQVQFAAEPVHLPVLVPRAEQAVAIAPCRSFLRRRRGGERVVPCSVQHEERGPMRLALSAERDHVGPRFAPVLESAGPFVGATHIEGQAAALQHRAVDDPGGDRRRLSGRDGDHDLVEHDQPALWIPDHDLRLPLAEMGEGDEVGIAEPMCELRRPFECVRGSHSVTRIQRAERLWNQQESLTRA